MHARLITAQADPHTEKRIWRPRHDWQANKMRTDTQHTLELLYNFFGWGGNRSLSLASSNSLLYQIPRAQFGLDTRNPGNQRFNTATQICNNHLIKKFLQDFHSGPMRIKKTHVGSFQRKWFFFFRPLSHWKGHKSWQGICQVASVLMDGPRTIQRFFLTLSSPHLCLQATTLQIKI